MNWLRFWKRMNELSAWLMIVVFSCIMLIGIWQMYDNYYLFAHTLDESIRQYKPDPRQPDAAEQSPITDDMAAWITIDGTGIDYPVMQGKDNSYYLNIDPFGNYALSGSIFLDCRCSRDLSDDYSVVYGHHMDYGKMFGALDAFLDAEYLSQHSTGTLMIGKTAEKTYRLTAFAAMKVSAREPVVFDLQQDRIRQYISDHAEVQAGSCSGRILALSTCADAGSSERIVVFCCFGGTDE